jgi:hypothetical protein
MPVAYPPAPPTLTGDILDINRFLQTPTLIQRALRTIAQQRFIGDFVLSGRGEAMGGAVLYEQNESIYPTQTVQSVEPGAEFPLTSVGTGPGLLAAVKKWGLDTIVTDEAIKRYRFDPVNRALTKLVNGVIKQVDTVALAAINAAVTQTQAVPTAWATSTTILRDILTARATVAALNQGYDPDTLVVDDLTWAKMMSDPTIAAALRRENPDNPVYTANLPEIAGLMIAPTPNLPTAGRAYVLDRKVLGSMIDEEPLTSRSIRQDAGPTVTEGWVLRAKRIVVPIVQEPNACVALTGI